MVIPFCVALGPDGSLALSWSCAVSPLVPVRLIKTEGTRSRIGGNGTETFSKSAPISKAAKESQSPTVGDLALLLQGARSKQSVCGGGCVDPGGGADPVRRRQGR
jgi:hypothetical protein